MVRNKILIILVALCNLASFAYWSNTGPGLLTEYEPYFWQDRISYLPLMNGGGEMIVSFRYYDVDSPIYIKYPDGVSVPDSLDVEGEFLDIVGVSNSFISSEGGIVKLGDKIEFVNEGSFCGSIFDQILFGRNLRIIGEATFNGLTLRDSIIFPNKLVSIGSNSFIRCNIKNIVFNESLYSIGTNCFQSNSVLETVVLPSRLHTLGRGCFNNCLNLKKVVLPQWLDFYDFVAFNDCPDIKEIQIMSATPPDLYDSFDRVDKETCLLIVPDGALQWYKNSYGWRDFVNILEVSQTTNVNSSDFEQSDIYIPKFYDLQGREYDLDADSHVDKFIIEKKSQLEKGKVCLKK